MSNGSSRSYTCSFSMCHQCMRHSHNQSPFHRIECWTGSFYRRASLWEVGNYILVKHHKGKSICDSLKHRIDLLERLENIRDEDEQSKLSAAQLPTATTVTTSTATSTATTATLTATTATLTATTAT